jgi:hypothetical protein
MVTSYTFKNIIKRTLSWLPVWNYNLLEPQKHLLEQFCPVTKVITELECYLFLVIYIYIYTLLMVIEEEIGSQDIDISSKLSELDGYLCRMISVGRP